MNVRLGDKLWNGSLLLNFKNTSKNTMAIDVDRWIEIAKDCKYLPENDLKVFGFFFVCYPS